jgi:dehydrogenase/reductase SDR family protein 7B
MKDKVVIITGGSSGIGKAMAEVFGMNGSKILITGRNLIDIDQAVADLRLMGIEAHGLQSDVSVEADNKKMAEVAIQHFGRIDILVNNAGITMRALFQEIDLSVIKKVMDINFFGVLYATQACLPEIIKNKGSIIGISSIAGYRGLPGRSGYSASKFALIGFLETLRTELLYKGVNVLTACPGFTASNTRKRALNSQGKEQGESPRDESEMMSAEECAQRIYAATVKRKKILIMTRQGKLTVLLNKIAPGFMDRIVYKTMAKEPDSPFK